MFLKPFRVKSQTAIKGSDRKKVRAEFQKQFPCLLPENANDIIPNKTEMSVLKLYTHSGQNAIVYCVGKNPIIFDIDGQLYPTIYTLWKFPDFLTVFRTWPQVFTKLSSGADLMLPGVIVKGEITPHTFGKLQKGDLCSVSLAGNRSPVAVGKAAMHGTDMFDSGMRGKGVHIIHILGDELWAFGDKSKPPSIPDTDFESSQVEDEEQDSNQCDETNNDNCDDMKVKSGRIVESGNSLGTDSEENLHGCEDQQCLNDLQDLNISENGNNPCNTQKLEGLKGDSASSSNQTGADCSDVEPMSTEEMDEMLILCFKCALKMSVTNSDLPLLTSAFFKNHMFPFCPTDKSLDIKKSSYKKLKKFLKSMESEGFVKVKELSEGVDSITEIFKSHKDLKNFTVPDGIEKHDDNQVAAVSADEYKPPKIVEMLSITAPVLPLLKGKGCSKGTGLTQSDLRALINDYVRDNNLQDENNHSLVQLDPILADIVLNKGENDTTHLRWDELFSRVIGKMQPAYQLEFPGLPPIYKKGKLEGIRLIVEQRASNKKITAVENLEHFGIDQKEFAHTVQKGVACSTSVRQSKTNKTHVVIQGNQIKHVADLLLGKYQIPRKYILGLEKAPKSGKRK